MMACDAGGAAAAFSISGGNAALARRLLESSSAQVHLSHRVTAVVATDAAETKSYRVLFTDANGAPGERAYDHVINAAPCAPTSAVRSAPIEIAIEQERIGHVIMRGT